MSLIACDHLIGIFGIDFEITKLLKRAWQQLIS
jgi:hypothetical protein